jgi:hypothetical protein
VIAAKKSRMMHLEMFILKSLCHAADDSKLNGAKAREAPALLRDLHSRLY